MLSSSEYPVAGGVGRPGGGGLEALVVDLVLRDQDGGAAVA